jgi:hypothetical protein
VAKKLTAKKIEAAIEASYKKHAAGRQINIFKIGQVFKDAKAAIEAAVQPAITPRPLTEGEVTYVLETVMPVIVAKYTEPVSSRPPDLNG